MSATTPRDAQDLPALPEPLDYCYEWDGPYGTRKFSPNAYNGRQFDRSVALYTADQMRAYARAALAQQAHEAQPLPTDWLLRSRVADLLHLLEFSSINTPTKGDEAQVRKALADLRSMLAAPVAQQGGEPPTRKLQALLEGLEAGPLWGATRQAEELRLLGAAIAGQAKRAAHAQQPAQPAALTDALPGWTFTRGADGRIVVGSPIYGPGVVATWAARSGGSHAERVLHALADALMGAGITAAPAPTTDTGEQR